MMLLDKFVSKPTPQQQADRQAKFYRDFLRREAKIGGELFGPLPKGARRDFVCLDEHTWVWHEEWIDGNNCRQARTTRYEVRPSGIIKSQDGQYKQVNQKEAKRLSDAAHEYYRRVKKELYYFV